MSALAVTTLSEADLTVLSVAKTVDARGTACPGPLLEAKKAMPSVSIGQIIEILSSDPETKNDIAVWSSKVGHDFLGVAVASGYDRVFVRRKK